MNERAASPTRRQVEQEEKKREAAASRAGYKYMRAWAAAGGVLPEDAPNGEASPPPSLRR
jgi:hypothetical protein